MRIWQGTTPDGYSLLVERDEQGAWVTTVASVSRSRNVSLVAAILEAAGSSTPRRWAEQLAAAIVARSVASPSVPTPSSNHRVRLVQVKKSWSPSMPLRS